MTACHHTVLHRSREFPVLTVEPSRFPFAIYHSTYREAADDRRGWRGAQNWLYIVHKQFPESRTSISRRGMSYRMACEH